MLGRGWRIEGCPTAFQIDTLDVLIILSLTDAGNQVVEAHSTHVAHVQDLIVDRAAFRPFSDGAIEFDDEDRIILDLGRG